MLSFAHIAASLTLTDCSSGEATQKLNPNLDLVLNASLRRVWRQDGSGWGHLVDPVSQSPASSHSPLSRSRSPTTTPLTCRVADLAQNAAYCPVR